MVGACDLAGRPLGLAPRSTRSQNGVNTHLSKNTFRVRIIHHGLVQVLVDCLVTDSLDQFLAVVGNDQPLKHEVGFSAISQ